MQKKHLSAILMTLIAAVTLMTSVVPAFSDASISGSITASAATTVTIKFNANGGNVSTSSMTYTEGNTLGALPTPTRSGYKFTGWYTKKSGGTKVTSSTVLSIVKNRTFYAHWTKKYTLTFNANGGSVSTTSKTYTKGSTLGTLPTPTRSGYKFTGWYTKKSGGTKVTSSTVLSVVKDRTFYAHWKKKYTLTFNANGGSVSTTTKTYYKGNTLGTLPTPTRSGYKFLGWYTKKSGGTKVTSNTVLSVVKDRTFYAHWESTASYVTLTFNANGGTVSSTSKTYTKGSKVGTLPTAKKSGYTFKGWYTKKSGGTRISYSTVLNDYYNRTFYAQYAVPSFATLRYSFENSLDDYGYTSSYSIPYKAYKYMFDDDYAKYVYSVVGRSSWGGNCFGMSSTSALFNTGKVKQQSFNSKIYFTKQLSLDDSSSTYGMTVREFIECMQVGQYDADIQETFYDNINDISTLVTKVKKCQAGSGSPVIIGLYNNSAGHAVLAYRWKYVSSTKDRIYIYDCNYADSYKYITLYKSGSSYTGFSYEDYTDLTWFTTSNVYEVWSNRDSSTYSSFSSLAVSLSDMKIYNSDGELCAEISNGEFESYRDEIYQAVSFGTTLESALIYLPDDEYTIVNQQDDEQISVTYYSDGEYAQTLSDADEITISQDVSEVEIYDSDGADYEITFYSDGGETTQSGSLDDGTYIIDESGEQAS